MAGVRSTVSAYRSEFSLAFANAWPGPAWKRQSLREATDCLKMTLRQMQVHGGVLEFGVTQQDLNGPKVR